MNNRDPKNQETKTKKVNFDVSSVDIEIDSIVKSSKNSKGIQPTSRRDSIPDQDQSSIEPPHKVEIFRFLEESENQGPSGAIRTTTKASSIDEEIFVNPKNRLERYSTLTVRFDDQTGRTQEGFVVSPRAKMSKYRSGLTVDVGVEEISNSTLTARMVFVDNNDDLKLKKKENFLEKLNQKNPPPIIFDENEEEKTTESDKDDKPKTDSKSNSFSSSSSSSSESTLSEKTFLKNILKNDLPLEFMSNAFDRKKIPKAQDPRLNAIKGAHKGPIAIDINRRSSVAVGIRKRDRLFQRVQKKRNTSTAPSKNTAAYLEQIETNSIANWLKGRKSTSEIQKSEYRYQQELEKVQIAEYKRKKTKVFFKRGMTFKRGKKLIKKQEKEKNILVKFPSFDELDEFLKREYIRLRIFQSSDIFKNVDSKLKKSLQYWINHDLSMLKQKSKDTSNKLWSGGPDVNSFMDVDGNSFSFQPYSFCTAFCEDRAPSFFHFLDYANPNYFKTTQNNDQKISNLIQKAKSKELKERKSRISLSAAQFSLSRQLSAENKLIDEERGRARFKGIDELREKKEAEKKEATSTDRLLVTDQREEDVFDQKKIKKPIQAANLLVVEEEEEEKEDDTEDLSDGKKVGSQEDKSINDFFNKKEVKEQEKEKKLKKEKKVDQVNPILAQATIEQKLKEKSQNQQKTSVAEELANIFDFGDLSLSEGLLGLSVFDKFGPGVNLFFTFSKLTILLFVFCMVLSLPLQYVNSKLFDLTFDPNIKPLDQVSILGYLNTFFISTTLGGLSSFSQVNREVDFKVFTNYTNSTNSAFQGTNTTQALKNSTIGQQKSYPLILSCDYGIMSVSPNQTKFGFFEKTKPINKLMFQVDDTCTNYTNVMISMQPCLGTNFCEIRMEKSWLRSAKRCIDMIETHRLVLSSFCKDIRLELPYLPFMKPSKRSILMSYFLNFQFSTLMMASYLFYLILLKLNFKSMTKEYYSKVNLPSEFALMLTNLPRMSEVEAIKEINKLFIKCDLLKELNLAPNRAKTAGNNPFAQTIAPERKSLKPALTLTPARRKRTKVKLDPNILDIQVSQTKETLKLEEALSKMILEFEMLFKRLMRTWKSNAEASWHFNFTDLANQFEQTLNSMTEIKNNKRQNLIDLLAKKRRESLKNKISIENYVKDQQLPLPKKSGGIVSKRPERSSFSKSPKYQRGNNSALKKEQKGFKNFSRNSVSEPKKPESVIDTSVKPEELKRCIDLCRKLGLKKDEIIDTNQELEKQKKARRRIKYAFVTFRTKEMRNFFFRNLPKSRLQGYLTCFKTINARVKGRLVVVSRPHSPINVNWWNISKSFYGRLFIRIACLAVFASLFHIPTEMRKFFMSFTESRRLAVVNPSCTAFGRSLNDHNIIKMAEGWMPIKTGFQCVCLTRPKLITETNLLQKYNLPSDLCSHLRIESWELSIFQIAESAILSLVTFCFDFLFEFMARLESYDNYNAHQISVLFKLFLWKSYTTTFLPVMLNSELVQRGNFYMFYDDLTPQWYLNVGVGIIKSAYFRLVFVLIEFVIAYYLPRFWQWRDRGYSNEYYRTRRLSSSKEVRIPNTLALSHKEYIKVYTNKSFNIDRSYAEILNVVTFCFTYCFILPHLFIPCTLLLIALHYKDKVLILTTFTSRYYLREQSYEWAAVIVGLVPIITMFTSFWIFGNTVYFSTTNVAPEVVVKHGGVADSPNSFGQYLYQNVSFLDGDGKWYALKEASQYLLDYRSYRTYFDQILLRIEGSVFYKILFYIFLGYFLIQLSLMLKFLFYNRIFKFYCFLRFDIKQKKLKKIFKGMNLRDEKTMLQEVIPMDQLVKEKLNYMISIEKNSFSGAQAVPKIPNTVPMRRACNKVYLTIINKASAQARVRRSSTLGVGFSDTDLAITQEILNPIERKKLIRNMFLERVLMVILHKARLNYESYLKAYLGREFKTLASYNYQLNPFFEKDINYNQERLVKVDNDLWAGAEKIMNKRQTLKRKSLGLQSVKKNASLVARRSQTLSSVSLEPKT